MEQLGTHWPSGGSPGCIGASRAWALVTETDIKRLLVNEGFDDERASHLAEVYRHGRKIIKVHRGSVPDGADDRWLNVGQRMEAENE